MKRITAFLLALLVLFCAAACDEDAAGTTGGGSTDSLPAENGDSSADGSYTVSSTRTYASMAEAEGLTEIGLTELRAYGKNAAAAGQLTAVENHYFNNYYLPYLKRLAKEQLAAKKTSVSSEWFTKQNQSMYYLPEDYDYGNIYKKLAQDMYTRMLPDPDDILEQVRKLAENNGFIFDADYSGRSTKEDRVGKLEEIRTECKAHHYVDHISDWRTIPEGAFTVEPRSDATVTLEELAEARARFERELYIQDVYISIKNEGILSGDRQRELQLAVMDILQPYCDTNSERLASIAVNGTEENLYRFDRYLEYFKKQVYAKKEITRPDFSDYFVAVQDEARYDLCDSYIDVEAYNSYDAEKGAGGAGIHISCGGNEIVPTARVKEHGSPYEVMGVYYPLLVPVFYSDAVINGFFEPYKIPDRLPEYEITVIPDYSTKYYCGDSPYVPLDVSSEGEAEGRRPMYLFTNGFGESAHALSWHEREKLDMGALGYTQNSDGTWDRSIKSRVEGVTSTLTYDNTWLLLSGTTVYNDLSYKKIEYKTDENGNAIMSIDKLYDKDGTLTDQAITEYYGETRTTAHYETSIRDGKQNYIKTDTERRDAQGTLISRTEYNANGSPNNETIVSSREELISGTAGGSRTKTIRTVTYITYDENGNVTGNHTVDVPVPENEEPEHAVKKYLEEHTGIRRD